jgi:hypothetical protein
MQTMIRIATCAATMGGALLLAGTADAQSNCSGQVAYFTCWLSSGVTICTPASGIVEIDTGNLLDAAQGCDSNITESTTLLITAAGASGGTGADFIVDGGRGGQGGSARLGTTLAHLDSTYGPPPDTTYCYGLGQAGGHGDTHSASGGASTLLRTCQDVSQTATTGVLLVAGGGGGGGAAGDKSGGDGGRGGFAFSTTAGACPPSCTQSGGEGKPGADSGGEGGFDGKGGAGSPAGGVDSIDGANGIGGKGGPEADTGTPGFFQGDPMVSGGTGQGGGPAGGGGGGGYGGGGSGYTPSSGQNTGGGGGGSYAAQSSVAFSAVPPPNSGNGYLTFAFQP